MRKTARWFGVVIGALLGAGLGLTGAALGTEAGRSVIVSALLAFADRALHGTLTIESFEGSLVTGLELRGVRLVDEDGVLLAEVPNVRARYRLSDLLSRRITLGQLTLTRPTVWLIERPDGRLNAEEVLGLGTGDGGTGGPGPLVAFRDVRISNARVNIVTRDETDEDPSMLIADAQLGYVRLSSPFPGEENVRVEIDELRSRTTGLPFELRGARGNVEIDGDTIRLDLDELSLPNSRATARGRLWDIGGDLGIDTRFEAVQVASADLRNMLPWLPIGVAGSGTFDVSVSGDVARVDATDLALVTANGGRLAGTIGFVAGPGDGYAWRRTDVTTDRFDLAYLRGILDTIPLDGRLTGRTRANGPRERVTAQVAWTFEDARAAGAVSQLDGSGTVEFGGDDVVFHDFAVRETRVALATVRGIVPGVALRGGLALDGMLQGPWRNAAFAGVLRHRDGTLPVSMAEGRVRLDTRRDTVEVWADLTVDSLQFEGIRPGYPAIPIVGAYRGTIAVAGALDSLVLHADLSGALGRARVDGVAVVVGPHLGFRTIDARFENVALSALRETLPRSRFTGRVRGRVETDTLVLPVVDLTVGLDPFQVGGVPFDSAVAHVFTRDSVLLVDTLGVWGRGITARAGGGIAIQGPRRDSLELVLDVDSAAAVAPLVLRLLDREADPVTLFSTRGRGTTRVVLRGALDTLAIAGTLRVDSLGWRDVFVPATVGAWRAWVTDRPSVSGHVTIDSIAIGPWAFSAIEGDVDGRLDSLGWIARARLGYDGAFLAGGRYLASSGRKDVALDSLAVLLADNVWFLQRGARVAVTDTAVDLEDVVFTTATGGSQVALNGTIPRRGRGSVTGRIGGLPIEDVRALLQRPVDRSSGVISGTVDLGGTAHAPLIEASLQVRRFVLNDFQAPLTRGRVFYRDRRLTGTVSLLRSGEEILAVDVDLPIDLALTGAAERLLPGALSIRARADGVDLSFLNAVTPQIRRASGRFWADFGITGAWERPELTGYLRFADGAASFPSLGVRHEQLTGRVELSGDTIRVRDLSARSGRGTARVSGFVRLEGLTRPRLRLAIEADEFRAVELPDFLALTASGAVQLTGPVFGAALTGSGTVTDGVLYFADIVEKEIIDLEDTVFAVDSATAALIRRQGLGADFENRFLDSLRIDTLRLAMGSNVRLRSGEADIQLTGEVTVSKLGELYRIDGTLQTPRGTYRLPLGRIIQKDFTVTRGEVRYFGTPDLNAALDIDARHQLRDVRGDPVTVFVHVGGTINSPRLVLSSDIQPPIAETEILSYLVFGAPSAQAAGGRFGQYVGQQTLSTWAARISGQLGNALISELSVPLDYFEIRPEFGGQGLGLAGTEIALGSRIGDRWFLTLNQRFCPEEAFTVENFGAAIEFRMSRQWRLSASFDPLLSCFTSAAQPSEFRYQFGFDVLWEKRY